MTAQTEARGRRSPDRTGRFAELPQPLAALVLAALAVLILAGLPYALQPAPVTPPAYAVNGITLYGRIVQRMRAGEPYEGRRR